jgi:hypothetical protein
MGRYFILDSRSSTQLLDANHTNERLGQCNQVLEDTRNFDRWLLPVTSSIARLRGRRMAQFSQIFANFRTIAVRASSMATENPVRLPRVIRAVLLLGKSSTISASDYS